MSEYVTVQGARVGVLMGSASDRPAMEKTSKTLAGLEITHECNVISAHRNPDRLSRYISDSETRGIEVFICAAGGAAHLAGVVAALPCKPVLGCPMKAWSTEGLDSLLSMAQMPRGIPVGTLAVGGAGAVNAALLAGQILALSDADLRARVEAHRAEQSKATSALPGAPGHPDAD